jgi:hypothetical protein
MLGLALENEYVTLVLGIFGCLAFLLVVTSRRDELSNLRDDLQDRLARGRQERTAAKLTWEAIQRIELSSSEDAAGRILDQAARSMGCRHIRIDGVDEDPSRDVADQPAAGMSGPSAIFRLSGGHGRWITIELSLGAEMPLAADIVFRYMQRLGQALAGRIEQPGEVEAEGSRGAMSPDESPPWLDRANGDSRLTPSDPSSGPRRLGRIAMILGRIGLGTIAGGVPSSSSHRPTVDSLAGPRTPARP